MQVRSLDMLQEGWLPFLDPKNSNIPFCGTNTVGKSWYTPLMPALGEVEAGGSEFEANLVYRASSSIV